MDNEKRPLRPERRSDFIAENQPRFSEETPSQSMQPVKADRPRHKNGRAFSFVSMLFLLTLLLAGVLTYFWYDEYQKNNSLIQENNRLTARLEKESQDENVDQIPQGDFLDASAVGSLARKLYFAALPQGGATEDKGSFEIVYIDEQFARVNIVVGDEKKDANNQVVIHTYFFKKIQEEPQNEQHDNEKSVDNWIVVAIDPDEAGVARMKEVYGVSDEAVSETNYPPAGV